MTAQDLIEKLKRYPIPTTCGGIILVCFFAFYLRMNLLTDLEIENGEVQRQAQQVEQNINNGKLLAEHIEQMKAKTGDLDARLIKHSELATNLKYFYEIEATTHVSINDLRQVPPAAVRGAPKTILTGVNYALLITGRFHQVISYVNELEHGRHFYRLENFSLQRGREDSAGRAPGTAGPVTMSLNLELLGLP